MALKSARILWLFAAFSLLLDLVIVGTLFLFNPSGARFWLSAFGIPTLIIAPIVFWAPDRWRLTATAILLLVALQTFLYFLEFIFRFLLPTASSVDARAVDFILLLLAFVCLLVYIGFTVFAWMNFYAVADANEVEAQANKDETPSGQGSSFASGEPSTTAQASSWAMTNAHKRTPGSPPE